MVPESPVGRREGGFIKLAYRWDSPEDENAASAGGNTCKILMTRLTMLPFQECLSSQRSLAVEWRRL